MQKATQTEKMFKHWLVPFPLSRASQTDPSEDEKFQFGTWRNADKAKKDIPSQGQVNWTFVSAVSTVHGLRAI